MDVTGLPPVAAPTARLLVLGSMPGDRSLREQRYYAHPRNLFWPFMGELLGAGPELPYEERLAVLERAGVALWDVLQHCHRPGSLDASIVRGSEVPNDLAGFLARHPLVRAIALNGGKARTSFQRTMRSSLPASIQVLEMPSTSPANAGQSRAVKRAAWSRILPVLDGPR
jgi:double-stranded uracil-DNA glycosylase